MPYVISFNEETRRFVMNGNEEKFIGDHFTIIAAREGLIPQTLPS